MKLLLVIYYEFILFSKPSADDNILFKVTLGGLIGSNVKFSGFFLQARFLKSWNIIGKWTFYANNTLNNHIGTMKCDNINVILF